MHDADGEKGRVTVSVAIVTHNCREELEACLERVHVSTRRTPLEVFVVDNASSDGTTRMVAERFPWVQLTANSENLYFARANNQALSQATGRYALVLNPDTLLEDSTIENMVRFMESHPEAGAASCVFVDGSGSIIPTCWKSRTLSWLLLSREPVVRMFRNSRLLRDASMGDWDRLSEREVDAVSGAFLFAGRPALLRIGLFDERFLLYLTDDDVCMRLRAAGYKLLHNPGARICHLVSRSTRKKPILAIQKIQRDDFVKYFRKHHGVAAALAAWVICSVELLVWWSYLLVRPGRAGGGVRA